MKSSYQYWIGTLLLDTSPSNPLRGNHASDKNGISMTALFSREIVFSFYYRHILQWRCSMEDLIQGKKWRTYLCSDYRVWEVPSSLACYKTPFTENCERVPNLIQVPHKECHLWEASQHLTRKPHTWAVYLLYSNNLILQVIILFPTDSNIYSCPWSFCWRKACYHFNFTTFCFHFA